MLLLLPKATTKYVRLTLANPDQLVMSEVLFWHSEIETQAGLTSGDAPAHTKWGGTDSESVRDQKTTSTSGDGDGDGDGDGHGGTSGDGDGELLLSRHVGITQMRNTMAAFQKVVTARAKNCNEHCNEHM